MRALLLIVLGVWSLFWLGCAASAVFGQGDVMGMIAFAVVGGLPWLWVSDVRGKASPSAE